MDLIELKSLVASGAARLYPDCEDLALPLVFFDDLPPAVLRALPARDDFVETFLVTDRQPAMEWLCEVGSRYGVTVVVDALAKAEHDLQRAVSRG